MMEIILSQLPLFGHYFKDALITFLSLVTPTLISGIQTFLKLDGNKKTLFYAEVSEKDRVSNGGGVAAEGEMIEVVELSLDEVKDYLKKNQCQQSCIYTSWTSMVSTQ